jgi:hypothetical protein
MRKGPGPELTQIINSSWLLTGVAMQNGQIDLLPLHSPLWVWDGTWLPATIAVTLDGGVIIVRFSHGVSAPIAASKVAIRNPALHGTDRPSMSRSAAMYVDDLRSECMPNLNIQAASSVIVTLNQ